MALAALGRARLASSSSLAYQVRSCSTASASLTSFTSSSFHSSTLPATSSPSSSSSSPSSFQAGQPCRFIDTCDEASRCPAAIALRKALAETGVMTSAEAGKRVDGTTVLVVLAGLSTLLLLWTSPADVHEAFEKPPRAAFRSHDLVVFPPSFSTLPPRPLLASPSGPAANPTATASEAASLEDALLRIPAVRGLVNVLTRLQPADPAIGAFKDWQSARRVGSSSAA